MSFSSSSSSTKTEPTKKEDLDYGDLVVNLEDQSDHVSIRSKIELYGNLISDSICIDSKPLIACLDEILKLFSEYFKFISKSETELITFHNHLSPIIEAKQNELISLYEKIDHLELFVNCLKKTYEELEAKMDSAEKRYGSKRNKLKRFIDSKLAANSAKISEGIPEANKVSSSLPDDEQEKANSSNDINNESKNANSEGSNYNHINSNYQDLDKTDFVISCEKAFKLKT